MKQKQDCCWGIGAVDVPVLQVRDGLIESSTAREIASIFASFSDPTRLRLVSMLVNKEMCVSELAMALGMSQSALSHQLSDMRQAHLVRSRCEGRHVFYILDDPHVRDLFRQALEHAQHR